MTEDIPDDDDYPTPAVAAAAAKKRPPPPRRASRPPVAALGNGHEEAKAPAREPRREDEQVAPLGKRREDRRRTMPGYSDKFHIPAHLIPPDTSLEWKRYATGNMVDTPNIASEEANGWRICQVDEFPGIAKRYGIPSGGIVVEGMALMERPIELTLEAISEMKAAARNQVRNKIDEMRGAPANSIFEERTRVEKLQTSIERAVIPD